MTKNCKYALDIFTNNKEKVINWDNSIDYNNTFMTSIKYPSRQNNRKKTENENEKLKHLSGKKISKKRYRKELIC
ncbi:MAG: hypothetical protein QW303_03105 [Nitrososphaerota archaeon]